MTARGPLPALLLALALPAVAAAQPWGARIRIEQAPPPAVEPARPATVTVLLPAEAELWFDGVSLERRGAVRTFSTPALAAGPSYVYRVTARWPGARGRDVVRVESLTVRAGERVTLDLRPPEDRRAVGVGNMAVEEFKGPAARGTAARVVGFQSIREFPRDGRSGDGGGGGTPGALPSLPKNAGGDPKERVPGFMSVITFTK